jgi:citrate synthase
VTVQETTLVPGLAGIPAAESAVSYIDGQVGILEYRGHRIETLAEHSNFEETCWLLLYGSLPSKSELDGFRARLREHRDLPERLINVIRALPGVGHPMDALQASLAALGMFHRKEDYSSREECDEAIVRIIAAVPVMIANFENFRAGRDYVQPDPKLDTAANFLWMINGTVADELITRVLDVALILHADHTMNASTFAARVVASTEADPFTVCSSAVGALTGPLHGGANERVLDQLKAIGAAENVPAWLDATLAAKSKIMGFGHRVYTTKDPRATILQDLARDLFETHGMTPAYETALALEAEVLQRLGSKGIYPNVDYFSGMVYAKLGIPTDLFTPVFAMSRVAGYLAHWREQMTDNRIFRPTQVFVGSHDAAYTPLKLR